MSKDDKSAVITFVSESVEHGVGFRLQYVLSGKYSEYSNYLKTTYNIILDCNRNYTGIQGKIKEDVIGQNCYILITVPEDRKISLYFDKFIMAIYTASRTCTFGWVKVNK